jgi:hypothetical protein
MKDNCFSCTVVGQQKQHELGFLLENSHPLQQVWTLSLILDWM